MVPVQAYMGGLPYGAGGAPVASTVAAVPMINGGHIPLAVPVNAMHGGNVQPVPGALQQPVMPVPETGIPAANANPPRSANQNETSSMVTDLGLTAVDLVGQNVVYTNAAKNVIGSALNLSVPAATSGVVNHTLNAAVGTVGAGVSAAVGTVGAVIHAHRDRGQLLEDYRGIISQQFGVPPERVTQDMLYQASEMPEHTALKQQLDAIGDKASGSAVRGAISGVAGALAGTGAAALSFVPTAGVGSVAAFMGGSIGGSMAANKVMDWVAGAPEYHTAYDAVLAMEAKMQEGKGASAADVFDMHVALNERTSLQLQEMMGGDFRTLDDAAKVRAMNRFPELRDQAVHEAMLINSGRLKPKDLLRGDVQQQISQMFNTQTQGIIPGMQIATQGHAMQPVFIQPGAMQAVNQNRATGFANRVMDERAVTQPNIPQV